MLKKKKELVDAIYQLAKAAGEDLEGQDVTKNTDLMTAMVIQAKDLLIQKIKELQDEKNKVNLVLNSIKQGLLVLDSHQDILLINSTAEEIKQKIDINTKEFIEAYKKAIENQEGSSFDYQIDNYIYYFVFTPFTTDYNENCVEITIEDVTKQRRIENAKIDFFSYASHELKSPLTAIIGYQEMIRSGLLRTPEEINQALDESLSEANNMKNMIRDMLDLSTLESKRARNTALVEVSEIIRNVLIALTPIYKKKAISVITELQDFTITANPQDIERLIRNLIDNAIKYNKVNGAIYIRLDSKAKMLTVKDSGIGMTNEELIHCFERFYRAPKANTLNEGSGLGLAIVKHVCNYYGYKINTESKLGVGTTFTIFFK